MAEEIERPYTLKLTKGQLKVLNDALDLFCRIGIGQLEEVTHMFRWMNDPRITDSRKLEAGEELLNQLKLLLFDKIRGANYGIGHQEVPDRYKVARDMHCMTEHRMWLDNPNRNNISVYSTLPFTFGSEPLMEIENDSTEEN